MKKVEFLAAILLLIGLSLPWASSKQAWADSTDQAQSHLAESQDNYFNALRSGQANTPEEKEKLQQSTLQPALNALSEASDQQAEQVRQKNLEQQRQNAAAAFAQKNVGLKKSASRSKTIPSSSKTIRPSPEPEMEPEKEPVVIDGTGTPKELIFPKKKTPQK